MNANLIIAWKVPKDIGLPFSPFWTAIGRVKSAMCTYYSPYGPLPPGQWEVDGEIERKSTRDVGILFTSEVVPAETVESHALIPLWTVAMGAYLWEVGQREGLPVELSNQPVFDPDEPGARVAALFMNPRHQWQLSVFDTQGPAGHDTDESPEKLLYEAYIQGYRYMAHGLVDAIVSMS
jgi:hypothetical protein